MIGGSVMGFFSNLFKKKENIQPTPAANMTIKAGVVTNELDIPPLQGDYAKTIFLWAHSEASPVKGNDGYARYFLYECGIRNAARYHQELISTGYFEEASVAQALNVLKVANLKDILTTLGQPTTGKKAALIERIVNNADGAVIAQYCPEKQYTLSALGQAFLNAHEDYVMVHKHKNWGVSWKEYDAHKIPERSYYDTMWAIFNEQLANNPRDFGRTQYLYMYQLLNEEGKRERALYMLLRVLYIDLSGVEGMQWYDMYRRGFYNQKQIRESFDIAIILAPGILNPIKDFKDIYYDELVDSIYEQKLPMQICEKKLFLNIVHSVLDGTYDQEATEEKLKRAYYKYLRETLFV
jgi:hypothetical protein